MNKRKHKITKENKNTMKISKKKNEKIKHVLENDKGKKNKKKSNNFRWPMSCGTPASPGRLRRRYIEVLCER